jgi:crotonobetainyl-CoA:carnitine CoA-transferase CaiB-like acyl-CoA transferase
MLLEVPMAGSAVNIAAEAVVEYSAYGNLVERNGNRSVFAAPQGMYLSDDELPDGRKDRWVVISVATDDQWRALASAIGRSELGDNPAFVDQAGRAADQDQLDEILSDWCASRSREEIVTTLWDAGVPAAKVELGHEHQEVEQLQARGYFSRVPHPLHGPIEQIGYPVRFSAGPDQVIRRHAPLLGEHNRDVLQGMLGLSDDELEELEAARVIGTAAAQSEQSWSV